MEGGREGGEEGGREGTYQEREVDPHVVQGSVRLSILVADEFVRKHDEGPLQDVSEEEEVEAGEGVVPRYCARNHVLGREGGKEGGREGGVSEKEEVEAREGAVPRYCMRNHVLRGGREGGREGSYLFPLLFELRVISLQ